MALNFSKAQGLLVWELLNKSTTDSFARLSDEQRSTVFLIVNLASYRQAYGTNVPIKEGDFLNAGTITLLTWGGTAGKFDYKTGWGSGTAVDGTLPAVAGKKPAGTHSIRIRETSFTANTAKQITYVTTKFDELVLNPSLASIQMSDILNKLSEELDEQFFASLVKRISTNVAGDDTKETNFPFSPNDPTSANLNGYPWTLIGETFSHIPVRATIGLGISSNLMVNTESVRFMADRISEAAIGLKELKRGPDGIFGSMGVEGIAGSSVTIDMEPRLFDKVVRAFAIETHAEPIIESGEFITARLGGYTIRENERIAGLTTFDNKSIGAIIFAPYVGVYPWSLITSKVSSTNTDDSTIYFEYKDNDGKAAIHTPTYILGVYTGAGDATTPGGDQEKVIAEVQKYAASLSGKTLSANTDAGVSADVKAALAAATASTILDKTKGTGFIPLEEVRGVTETIVSGQVVKARVTFYPVSTLNAIPVSVVISFIAK